MLAFRRAVLPTVLALSLACAGAPTGEPPAEPAPEPAPEAEPASPGEVTLTGGGATVRMTLPADQAAAFAKTSRPPEEDPGDDWVLVGGEGGGIEVRLHTWDEVLTDDGDEPFALTAAQKQKAVAQLQALWDTRDDAPMVDARSHFAGQGLFWSHEDFYTAVYAHAPLANEADDLRGLWLVGTSGQDDGYAPHVLAWLGRPADRLVVEVEMDLPEAKDLGEKDGPAQVAAAFRGGSGPVADRLRADEAILRSITVERRAGEPGHAGKAKGKHKKP